VYLGNHRLKQTDGGGVMVVVECEQERVGLQKEARFRI